MQRPVLITLLVPVKVESCIDHDHKKEEKKKKKEEEEKTTK